MTTRGVRAPPPHQSIAHRLTPRGPSGRAGAVMLWDMVRVQDAALGGEGGGGDEGAEGEGALARAGQWAGPAPR